jgi:hypothetical protein
MSFKTNLRKLTVIGAIFGLALTGNIAAAPAQATPAAPVQVSTSLTSPRFIADFNGGLYFTATPDGGTVFNLYFYNGSSDPKLVVGGEDSGRMNGHAVKFDSKIFFTTGNASYSISSGMKLAASKAFASISPSSFVVVGKNMFFAGRNANQDTVIYKWTGGKTNPASLEGVGNAPSNFRRLETVGTRLAVMDSSRFLYLSSDASGTSNPNFTHITFDVAGTSYETRESNGFMQVGNKIYFETHEMFTQTYVIMSVDITGNTYSQATQPLFSNGDALVNAGAPVLLGKDIFIRGSRLPSGSNAGPNTLVELTAAGTVEEAPGISGPDALINFSGTTYYGETNDTALGFFVVGDRLFLMNDDTLDLFVYRNGTLEPLKYNGTQLQYINGFTTVGSKMIFGATDPSAAGGTPEQSPVFTLDLSTGSLTEVTVPTQLRNAFLAGGHMYFSGLADLNADPTLWVDEKPTPVAAGATKVSGFYGDSSWVNPNLAKKLAKLATSPSTITKVICTGTTAGTKATKFDKKLALARATNACKYIKSIVKKAQITVIAKPATGADYSNRAVLVEVIH